MRVIFLIVIFPLQIAQTLYFSLSTVYDVCGSDTEKVPEKPSTLRKVKDYMFSAIVFPVTTVSY